MAQFSAELARHQPLWDELDDLDANCWVLEPAHPTRDVSSRRLALGQHCSLSVALHVAAPASLPELAFLGAERVIGPLRRALNARLHLWEPKRSVRLNLEASSASRSRRRRRRAPKALTSTRASAPCTTRAPRRRQGARGGVRRLLEAVSYGMPGRVAARGADDADVVQPAVRRVPVLPAADHGGGGGVGRKSIRCSPRVRFRDEWALTHGRRGRGGALHWLTSAGDAGVRLRGVCATRASARSRHSQAADASPASMSTLPTSRGRRIERSTTTVSSAARVLHEVVLSFASDEVRSSADVARRLRRLGRSCPGRAS